MARNKDPSAPSIPHVFQVVPSLSIDPFKKLIFLHQVKTDALYEIQDEILKNFPGHIPDLPRGPGRTESETKVFVGLFPGDFKNCIDHGSQPLRPHLPSFFRKRPDPGLNGRKSQRIEGPSYFFCSLPQMRQEENLPPYYPTSDFEIELF
jgi:hypothetical protein